MAISLLLLAKGRAFAPIPSLADSRYGYGGSGNHRWLSAGLSLGIAGVVGAALVTALAVPDLLERAPNVITGTHIPLPQPTEPEVQPPLERPATPAQSEVRVLRRPIDFPPLGNPPIGEIDPGLTVPPPGPEIGTGSGGGEIILRDPPPPATIFRGATRDPRFARSFQPAYPPALEREGVVGTAQVRVRIGTDGRVIAVENLGATDLAFFTATERQALRHWRFRPATRDGMPVESAQVLTVRFQVPDPD